MQNSVSNLQPLLKKGLPLPSGLSRTSWFNKSSWKRFNQDLLGDLIRMVWPPQSPDLNPIEQIWDHLDTEVHKHHISPKENISNNLAECNLTFILSQNVCHSLLY